jgi:hypothetical protein
VSAGGSEMRRADVARVAASSPPDSSRPPDRGRLSSDRRQSSMIRRAGFRRDQRHTGMTVNEAHRQYSSFMSRMDVAFAFGHGCSISGEHPRLRALRAEADRLLVQWRTVQTATGQRPLLPSKEMWAPAPATTDRSGLDQPVGVQDDHSRQSLRPEPNVRPQDKAVAPAVRRLRHVPLSVRRATGSATRLLAESVRRSRT